MIIVDKREKNSLVISELIRRKIPIEIKQLEIGDYIIGDTIIERKTKSDFISSIINKRLLEQLNNMKQFPNKLLVLEEDPTCCERNINIHPNAIRGMILSISLDFHTPIIHTSGYNETVDFLEVLNKRYENGGKEISLKMKKKALSLVLAIKFDNTDNTNYCYVYWCLFLWSNGFNHGQGYKPYYQFYSFYNQKLPYKNMLYY